MELIDDTTKSALLTAAAAAAMRARELFGATQDPFHPIAIAFEQSACAFGVACRKVFTGACDYNELKTVQALVVAYARADLR